MRWSVAKTKRRTACPPGLSAIRESWTVRHGRWRVKVDFGPVEDSQFLGVIRHGRIRALVWISVWDGQVKWKSLTAVPVSARVTDLFTSAAERVAGQIKELEHAARPRQLALF